MVEKDNGIGFDIIYNTDRRQGSIVLFPPCDTGFSFSSIIELFVHVSLVCGTAEEGLVVSPLPLLRNMPVHTQDKE